MELIDELKSRNEILFYFGAICFAIALVCLVLARTSPLQVLGTSAWFKPMKFFLSTAIFVWSMGWFCAYLNQPGTVTWYSWAMVALFTFEDAYILLQAARGITSHFNISTQLYSTMWVLMAIAAVLISVLTIFVGSEFFIKSLPELDRSYLWGIRFGILIFFIFSMEGMVMGAMMAHTVGGQDGGPGMAITNWSKEHGDLRVAHFFGMHALQILPLLGFYVFKKPALTIALGVIYLLAVMYLFLNALKGSPLIRS